MSAINDLIKQVNDPQLRERIQKEVDKLSKQKKFGLVFEEHLPECTPLYDIPIKTGIKVALKNGNVSDFYIVLKVVGDKAICVKPSENVPRELHLDELVAIAEFGDPIYPYLKPIDSICNAPESDLWHTLIEADNYHALQLLEYLYAGKVDCIYIDPPYNTGARDWKYNNNFVDSTDTYRHSKWLSFMEKRLKIAKRLLTPKGVIIIAIDDYEAATLTLLAEEVFAGYDVNTVIINHHPQGGAADNISRTHEYALFIVPKGQKIIKGQKEENISENWSLMRGGTDVRNLRKGRPNSFYAIYVEEKSRKVVGVGPRLGANDAYDRNEAPDGCVAFYPIGKDGTERVWRYEHQSMQSHIEAGEIICTPKMTLNVVKRRDVKYAPVFSVWTDSRYNAGTHGTNMIYDIFSQDTRFSYPKSLYSVKDCIKYAVQDLPNAIILDFFAGSGTTLHAVNLLNAEDAGRRMCIMVTNNEVSDEEEKILTKKGHMPGDSDWEKLGVARHITWPRTVCTIKGRDIKGNPLKGFYLDSEASMDAGFKANAVYFKLGFLDKTDVALGTQFKELLPTIWMKAGSVGKCPYVNDNLPDMLVLPENKFAVLINEKEFASFEEELRQYPEIQTVFIVTDYEVNYRSMVHGLQVKTTYQLYRDYLDNFRINHGRTSR